MEYIYGRVRINIENESVEKGKFHFDEMHRIFKGVEAFLQSCFW